MTEEMLEASEVYPNEKLLMEQIFYKPHKFASVEVANDMPLEND